MEVTVSAIIFVGILLLKQISPWLFAAWAVRKPVEEQNMLLKFIKRLGGK